MLHAALQMPSPTWEIKQPVAHSVSSPTSHVAIVAHVAVSADTNTVHVVAILSWVSTELIAGQKATMLEYDWY